MFIALILYYYFIASSRYLFNCGKYVHWCDEKG